VLVEEAGRRSNELRLEEGVRLDGARRESFPGVQPSLVER
jgi:hypothetical protein